MEWGENLPMDTVTALLTAPLEGDDKWTPSDRYVDVCHLCGADQALSSKFGVFLTQSRLCSSPVLQRVLHS